MSAYKPVRVRLTGPDPERSVLLLDFINVCRALRQSLRNVERCVTGADAQIDYEVSRLSSGSALLEAVPHENGTPASGYPEVRRVFESTVIALQSEASIDSRLDYTAIRAFQGFCGPLNTPGVALEIDDIAITNAYVRQIRKLLEPDSKARGSVSGLLKTLTTHQKNEFVLYPPGTDEEISCMFPEAELPRVLEAVERQVTVYGILHYSKGRSFPIRADVESFTAHPEDPSIPSLIDALGADSGESPSPVELVQAAKDGWE